MTLSLHVTNDVIVYFYHTYSSSAASAYVIPIFTTPRRHIKRIKGNTGLIPSFIKRTAAAATRRLPTYLLTSDDMDEFRSLEKIEELCRNLREQQSSSTIITNTG